MTAPMTAAASAPIEDDKDAQRTEQRRMWCLSQAVGMTVNVLANAPKAPPLDTVRVAEEMLEFIETGVARTHKPPSTTQ